MEKGKVHEIVKAGYGQIAGRAGGCCGPDANAQAETAARIGYSQADIEGAGTEANLGLGCGNPTALAALARGETVVDLGSGAGFDALIAAQKLGPEGRFIGIDMTPEMLERARINAVRAGVAKTVEFREGLIEAMPVTSESVDVVISNCVINLSPDKPKVFAEAFRVLKHGGRLAVTDIVLSEPLPPGIAELAQSWIACVGGAATEEEYLGGLRRAGFVDVEHTRRPAGQLLDTDLQDPLWKEAVERVGEAQLHAIEDIVFSYSVKARKP